jgi:hypothetical protein
LRAAYLNGVHTLPPSEASEVLPARRTPLVLAVAIAAAALLIAASLLWVSYGTTVFFEMLAAGIAACF